MAKLPDTYDFKPEYLLELMIKDAGLHEGRWMLKADFEFKAGNFAVNEEGPFPGAVMLINGLTLDRAESDEEMPLTMDASKVNPQNRD